MFNCSKLFSTAAPAEDCQPPDSDCSLLAATESEGPDCAAFGLIHTSSDEGSLLLASDADESKPAKRRYEKRKHQIFFLGKEVCVYALQSLLGIDTSTIQRIRRGEPGYTNQRRRKSPKHPVFGFSMADKDVSTKWAGMVMFLWKTYQSCAELMPTDFKMPKDEEAEVPETKDPDLEIRLVNHFIQSLQTYAADPDLHLVGPGTFARPCQRLQVSSRTELYWEYYAACLADNASPASYSTFLRVANAILRPGMRSGHLKFRGVNQHGKCNTCFELKLKIKSVHKSEQRQEAYRLYSHHLLSQWLDRQYWSYRAMSHCWVKTMVDMGTCLELQISMPCFQILTCLQLVIACSANHPGSLIDFFEPLNCRL